MLVRSVISLSVETADRGGWGGEAPMRARTSTLRLFLYGEHCLPWAAVMLCKAYIPRVMPGVMMCPTTAKGCRKLL